MCKYTVVIVSWQAIYHICRIDIPTTMSPLFSMCKTFYAYKYRQVLLICEDICLFIWFILVIVLMTDKQLLVSGKICHLIEHFILFSCKDFNTVLTFSQLELKNTLFLVFSVLLIL